MKKTKFLLLTAFSLFVLVPFSVSAEVFKHGDIVYVKEELTINCDGALEPYYEETRVDGTIAIYDDYDGEYYLYDLSTKTCSLMSEDEEDLYLIDDEITTGYEIRDNKLYYFENSDRLHSYDVECSSCEGGYEEKHFIDTFNNAESLTFYKYDGNGIASLVTEEGYCATNWCLIEVDPSDYNKETFLANLDENKFQVGEYDITVGNKTIEDGQIEDYFVFNNTEYIIISGVEDISGIEEDVRIYYLYTIDGDLQFYGSAIECIGDKYLYAIENDFDNLETATVRYYNSNMEIIFEKIFSSNNLEDSLPYLVKMYWDTNYENSVISRALFIVDFDENNIGKTKELFYVIRDYKIESGANQVYANKDLMFRINGDYELFEGIEINGKSLSKDNYIAEKGSTIITLKNDYLKNLPIGSYKLRINYSDEGYVETTFEIKKLTGTDEDVPQTFDGVGSSIMIATLALLGLASGTIYLIKNNKARA